MRLFEQFPLLKERIPHVQLGGVPTPVRHLRHFGKEIGNDHLYLKHVYSAEMHHFKNEIAAYIPTTIMLLWKKLKQGRFPYIIGPGGSSPLGIIGYVNAGFELKEQVKNGLVAEHDTIFVPLGTMGTAVGLTIGLKAAGLKSRVVSVRVADVKYGNKEKFVKLIKKTLAFILSLDSSLNKMILFWNTYNPRDLSHATKGIDYHQLPRCFHQYFEEDVQPLNQHSSE
jgi:1-aminocyclopropane-1-carboxylate deaminase/D-cysteine desulfhydrase-like pyridoxal-dependent ACC family enzyme